MVRRWRLWECFMGKHKEEKAQKEIDAMKKRGFDAKVYAPLPQHRTSGHVHVVVLCTFDELLKLAGITKRSPRVRGVQLPKCSIR